MSEWFDAEGDVDISPEAFGLSAGAKNADAARRMLDEAWPVPLDEAGYGSLHNIPVEVRVRIAPWWIDAVAEAEEFLEAGYSYDSVDEWLNKKWRDDGSSLNQE